ncbi:MAG: glycosyltransferase family 4 protein [Candidatus Moranbacteria bacterium]|nr:glycosyltransferase family 4 protein [Candidatus Moranbacteria bacterium]
MIIGIDASRAFLKKRTGIEEYSYQVIKHLRTELTGRTVFLYVRKKISWQSGRFIWVIPPIDFDLPLNWQLKALWAPRFWTQLRLSLEMLLSPPDVLFVPAHTVPFIHPARTIVTIHGLEYEFCPEAYSWYERWYMRISIRCSCRWAQTVVCVSENTKRDVMKQYLVPEEKIRVVFEGYDQKNPHPASRIQNRVLPYLFFIGRLEERKNILRIIEAFEILKQTYRIPHELVLVGKPGYGYEKIRSKIHNLQSNIPIYELGYVNEEEKWLLLRGADVFVFPTLYEGFGIPILEAQAAGTPVVTSNVSSMPEVGGDGAVYVNPESAESIAEGVWQVLSDPDLKNGIIEKATQNLSRFGWASCAQRMRGIVIGSCPPASLLGSVADGAGLGRFHTGDPPQ